MTERARGLAGAAPVARPVGHQRWRDLLFLHWPMAPAAVRRQVPPELELHLHDGQAWVSAIPFRIEDSLPAGAPRALAMSFLETNLRTYVLGPDGEPGIVFWSLEASSLLAVAGARLGYGLPYFPARMRMRRLSSGFDYATRRWGSGAGLTATWTVGVGAGIRAARDAGSFSDRALHPVRSAARRPAPGARAPPSLPASRGAGGCPAGDAVRSRRPARAGRAADLSRLAGRGCGDLRPRARHTMRSPRRRPTATASARLRTRSLSSTAAT